MTTITFQNLPDGTVDVQLHDPAGEPESAASALASAVFANTLTYQRMQQAHAALMRACGYTDDEIWAGVRERTIASAGELV